ncbi:MAG: hypothetical protein AB1305_03230 [Candidatus Hadarchaeota archaeon]
MFKRLAVFALLGSLVVGATLGVVAAQENTATVYGTIYDIWTFEPLENVDIAVYSGSAVVRQIVSTTGTYSLSLQPGSYRIVAKYYQQAIPVYETEENITLQPNDNVLLDLIMFPAEEEAENFADIVPEYDETAAALPWLGLAIILVAVVAIAIVFYNVKMMKLVKKETSSTQRAKVVAVPDDLEEVMDIIRQEGGRINQVELRKKMPYSEAKVSLMISDLEDRGLVRKVKKGRANVIILAES